jgi:hypothetical protein
MLKCYRRNPFYFSVTVVNIILFHYYYLITVNTIIFSLNINVSLYVFKIIYVNVDRVIILFTVCYIIGPFEYCCLCFPYQQYCSPYLPLFKYFKGVSVGKH